MSSFLGDAFGWCLVAYFAGLALWFVGGLARHLCEYLWDDVIPRLQGREARRRYALLATVPRHDLRRLDTRRIPRRDLRDSER